MHVQQSSITIVLTSIPANHGIVHHLLCCYTLTAIVDHTGSVMQSIPSMLLYMISPACAWFWILLMLKSGLFIYERVWESRFSIPGMVWFYERVWESRFSILGNGTFRYGLVYTLIITSRHMIIRQPGMKTSFTVDLIWRGSLRLTNN